jgi:hypothetical protein
MFTNQTINRLVFEDVKKIEFPKDIQKYIQSVDWLKQTWIVSGLPAFDSKFSISSEMLYFEENESGDMALKKIDFTGEIEFNTTLINPGGCGNNFILSFKGLIFKGLFCEAELKEFKTLSYAEYEEGFQKYIKAEERDENRLKSFWFRFIYRPYFFVLKWLALTIVYSIEFLLKVFCFFVDKIMPFKL